MGVTYHPRRVVKHTKDVDHLAIRATTFSDGNLNVGERAQLCRGRDKV